MLPTIATLIAVAHPIAPRVIISEPVLKIKLLFSSNVTCIDVLLSNHCFAASGPGISLILYFLLFVVRNQL
ncbi:hypothetical protein [Lysinibacillus sp. TE18511]